MDNEYDLIELFDALSKCNIKSISILDIKSALSCYDFSKRYSFNTIRLFSTTYSNNSLDNLCAEIKIALERCELSFEVVYTYDEHNRRYYKENGIDVLIIPKAESKFSTENIRVTIVFIKKDLSVLSLYEFQDSAPILHLRNNCHFTNITDDPIPRGEFYLSRDLKTMSLTFTKDDEDIWLF